MLYLTQSFGAVFELSVVLNCLQVTDTDHIDRLMSCLGMALPLYAVFFLSISRLFKFGTQVLSHHTN